jgi:hypothetical protein
LAQYLRQAGKKEKKEKIIRGSEFQFFLSPLNYNLKESLKKLKQNWLSSPVKERQFYLIHIGIISFKTEKYNNLSRP